MLEELKQGTLVTVPYLRIKDDVYEIWLDMPYSNGFYTIVTNASLKLHGDLLDITGEKLVWGFNFGNVLYKDANPKPLKSFVERRFTLKYIHKLKFYEFFVKTGWYIAEKKEPFSCITNVWNLKF